MVASYRDFSRKKLLRSQSASSSAHFSLRWKAHYRRVDTHIQQSFYFCLLRTFWTEKGTDSEIFFFKVGAGKGPPQNTHPSPRLAIMSSVIFNSTDSAATLSLALKALKKAEDGETKVSARAIGLKPLFSGLPKAVDALEKVRSLKVVKSANQGSNNWFDIARSTKAEKLRILTASAKKLESRQRRFQEDFQTELKADPDVMDRQLVTPVRTPKKNAGPNIVCNTRNNLLDAFNEALDEEETQIGVLEQDLLACKFNEDEETAAKEVCIKWAAAATFHMGHDETTAWNECIRDIIKSFQSLKVGSKRSESKLVQSALNEQITLCVRPQGMSLADFAPLTVELLHLCIWATLKVEPQTTPGQARVEFQDALVACLRNGANQQQHNTLMTNKPEPEASYLERCVHSLVENSRLPETTTGLRKVRTAKAEEAQAFLQEEESEDEEKAARKAKRAKKEDAAASLEAQVQLARLQGYQDFFATLNNGPHDQQGHFNLHPYKH